MKQPPRSHLSWKLLRVALLTALLVGFVLSLVQIVYGAYHARQLIEMDARQILRMSQGPATQALYSLDRRMGGQVMGGLFQHQAMREASIRHLDALVLAERSIPLASTATRWLTDPILGHERRFSIPLIGDAPDHEHYGDLAITLDSAVYGEQLVYDSLLIVVMGLARALVLGVVLYLVYECLLTRPLRQLVEHLARINPDQPGQRQLPLPQGHEDNELGLWARTANELLASIERNLHLRHEAETSLSQLSRVDALTGLPNRTQLQTLLAPLSERAHRQRHPVAVLCIGLDDFKGINERFGYLQGDRLLVELTARLEALGSHRGILARFGGDAFALAQPIARPDQAAALAEAVLATLETPFTLEQHSGIRLRATVGICLYPDDGDDMEKLLQKAEQTMTLAKQRARGRFLFYVEDMDLRIRERRELQEHLAEALANNEFHLVYQPQYDLAQGRIVAFEALLRWHLPSRGLISPELFIPLAEESGSIVAIGEWVLEQACQQLQQWHRQGLGHLRMAVNLSTVQLYHPATPALIVRMLERYRLPPESLEVEVTETVLMDDISSAADILHQLRRAGALIAIDDFGTGYSSLSYLRSLPVDKIKIDKSFVRDLHDNEDDASIVRAVIQLGTSLGMRVIAEGVETGAQEAYLIAQGCHEAQGYYYSKPLPARQLGHLLPAPAEAGA